MIDKVSDRLPSWKSKLLSKAGRAVLVKSTLSAIPVHTAMVVDLSPWAVKCIDKKRRTFLRKGSDEVKGGHCMLAWPKVCRPPELGGLGFLDLQLFGYALRMRWLWLKRTDDSRPWSQLPDRGENVVQAMFQASISIDLGDGASSFFWTDRWIQGKSIRDLALCLFNAVGSWTQRTRTVAQGLQGDRWVKDISGALTEQVILDFLLVWDITRTITLRAGIPDRLLWKWTSDQNFSTASAYKAFFIGQSSILGSKILSKTRAPGKCKFFGWLVLHDRCWTSARRRRHNLQTDDSCALGCQESETITHLLVGCSFAREIWHAVLLRLHWQQLAPGSNIFCLVDWWSLARKLIPKTDRRSFDCMVILISWILWNERNKRVFYHQVRTSRHSPATRLYH